MIDFILKAWAMVVDTLLDWLDDITHPEFRK